MFGLPCPWPVTANKMTWVIYPGQIQHGLKHRPDIRTCFLISPPVSSMMNSYQVSKAL